MQMLIVSPNFIMFQNFKQQIAVDELSELAVVAARWIPTKTAQYTTVCDLQDPQNQVENSTIFLAKAGTKIPLRIHQNMPFQHTHTHTHTIVLLLFWNLSGTTRISRYQRGKTRKDKTNLDLLEQEIVSGSGICYSEFTKTCHFKRNSIFTLLPLLPTPTLPQPSLDPPMWVPWSVTIRGQVSCPVAFAKVTFGKLAVGQLT